MEEALIAQLLANAPLAALVGTRIHWGVLPTGTAKPAVVLYRITPGRIYTQKGVADLAGPLVQADAIAATYTAAKATATALAAAFHGLADPFRGAFIESERDDYDGEGPERLFRRSLDVTTWIAG